MNEFREQMDAEQFAIWLNGYLAGRPELGNEEIQEQLERVVGGIVKRKLLGPSWILRANEEAVAKQQAKNWPLPPAFKVHDDTADALTWTLPRTTCAAGMLAGAQCDEEQLSLNFRPMP